MEEYLNKKIKRNSKNYNIFYYGIIIINQMFFIYYLSGTNFFMTKVGYCIHIISIILLGFIFKFYFYKNKKKNRYEYIYNKLFFLFLMIFTVYYLLFFYYSFEYIHKNLYNFILFSFIISEILNSLLCYNLLIENEKKEHKLLEKELD